MVLSLADTSCCCPLSGRSRDCSLITEGKSSFLNCLTNSTRESYTSTMKSCASKIKVGTHPTVTLMSPAFREFFKAAACRLLVFCWNLPSLSQFHPFHTVKTVSHLTPGIPTVFLFVIAKSYDNTGVPSCSVCNRSVSACKSWRVVRLGAVFVDPWILMWIFSCFFVVIFFISWCYFCLLTDMISFFKYTLETKVRI